MDRINKKWRLTTVLSVTMSLLFIYLAYNMNMYVKDYYNNSEITKVFLTLSDVKAGLEKTKTQTVTLSNQQEIQDIIDVLQQRTLIRTFPNLGPVSTNQNDRLELRIILSSTNKGILDYLITSEGHVEVRKGNDDFSNVIVLHGSALTWFDDLHKLINNRD